MLNVTIAGGGVSFIGGGKQNTEKTINLSCLFKKVHMMNPMHAGNEHIYQYFSGDRLIDWC